MKLRIIVIMAGLIMAGCTRPAAPGTAGGNAAGVDFLGFPPGSITGEVEAAQSQVQNIGRLPGTASK